MTTRASRTCGGLMVLAMLLAGAPASAQVSRSQFNGTVTGLALAPDPLLGTLAVGSEEQFGVEPVVARFGAVELRRRDVPDSPLVSCAHFPLHLP